MTEEYFPRGGKKPNVTYFKQSSNFLGAAEKGQGKKKKQKKRSENDDGYLSDEAVNEVDQSYKMCAAGIGHKTLKPGVKVLARVWRVLDTKLVVKMPSKMEGSVMACHISEPYNKVLEAYVNDQVEKVRELPEMFSPGQYVAVHVLEESSSENVMLSMMPQHVNSGRTHSDLLKGDILQAAVSSVEDHGYVMDIGVDNTRAFLPKADANPEIELDAGMLTWTSVKSVTTTADSSIVTLSSTPSSLQKALRRKKGVLLPGTAVEFIVDKPLDNGIEGRVLDSTAYIQRFHADRANKKPALGQKIKGYVLYVMPTRNAPFLTTRAIFESARPSLDDEMKLKEGDIVDEAQVLKIAGRSIHFKLGKQCVGTMSLKRVAVYEDLSDEEVVAQSYPIGSTHRVRILTYNPSDYIYHVTDEAKLLTEKYFSYSQLSAGELVTGSVRSVADSHVLVTVGRLTGYVPQLHLSDAGVYIDPKKATTSKLTKKKYKVGQEVTARVIFVDALKQKLTLSLKPSLLSPGAKLLSSYEQAEIGKAYTGVIKIVKDYVLVSFLNEVLAYVPRTQVSRTPVDNLTEAFHPGQVVGCTVLDVHPEDKKMLGSLVVEPFWPAKRSSEHTEKLHKESDGDGAPKKKRKSSESDETETKKSKKDKKKTSKVDEESAADSGSDAVVLESYEEAEIGKAYTGVVKVVKDYVLVSFRNEVTAYVPRTQVSRTPVDNLSEAFHKGQVVSCTVLDVNPTDKKMLGSLILAPFWPAKRSNEYHKNETDVDEVLKKQADETETKTSKKDKKKKSKGDEESAADTGSDAVVMASYEQAEIGKAYTGVVKVVKDYVLVSFRNEVTAYVPRTQVSRTPVNNLSEAFHKGQVVSCTVLDVNPTDKKMLGSLILAPFWPAKRGNEYHKNETDVDEVLKKQADETETKTSKKDKKKKSKGDEESAADTGSDALVLASYEEAEIGKAYTGVVKVVKDYVLVSFRNEVIAYVPKTQVSRTPSGNVTELFHPGQVVRCTVLDVKPGERKMLGSLILAPFWPAKRSSEYIEKRKKEIDDDEVPNKKRKTSESDDTDTKKSKKDKNIPNNVEDSDTNDTKTKKKKKDKNKKETKDTSEESDAIETDIHEDSDQVLTPEDLALIDLSDCETAKQWKKRVVSLMKSVKCRLHRIERIDKKIANIENEGLNANNKKFHTAMHQEKLVIEERIKKLMETMKTAQEKLKEFDENEYRDPNYKEKQKQKKQEKLKAMKLTTTDEDSEDEPVSKIKKNKKEKSNKVKQDKVEQKDKEVKETKKRGKDKNKKEVKEVVDKSKDIKVVESLEPAFEVPSAKEFWSESADILANQVAAESSSSSEDEDTEQPKKKRKKLTAAEKVAKARAEEERVRELERRAVESEAQPRSSDQFERALLANPNCSQLWIAYMAFHLQATEIDKARAVGRKALNTISFREEHEKLNVWLAMLNVEHRFGTKESQQKTLEEALQMNDTFKVHTKLLDIYCDTSKHQELSSLVDLMLRKYKREPTNYIQCGAACFKLGLVDKARHVMQKAVSVLEKKEHVTVLVQFALLERAHGERERAEALFEQVLAVYPQRLDVCAAYTDMLAKERDIQAVRQVMERMTSQKLPARKMKTLFNKWAELEDRVGDPAKAEEVRERAVRFMESAKF